MLSAAAILIGIITFYIKLTKDSEVAAYRETIGYIDRHSKEIWEQWDAIQDKTADSKQIRKFLNRLEQMALLVNKKAFDNDLVYNSFWMLYCQPLTYETVREVFESLRIKDKFVFAEYKKLSETWAPRIHAEENGGTESNPL